MRDVITFAIGDVHGCLGKLESLIRVCEMLCAGRDARFILIGDYVDRGPDPKGVIDFLRKKQLSEPERFVCLRGNHEQMLMAAADVDRSDSDLINWWANGGEQTLDSYGLGDPSEIPQDHLAWIRNLPLKLTDHKRLYVHAGTAAARLVRPAALADRGSAVSAPGRQVDPALFAHGRHILRSSWRSRAAPHDRVFFR
jgi:serine/threonine protein phosphatase 1